MSQILLRSAFLLIAIFAFLTCSNDSNSPVDPSGGPMSNLTASQRDLLIASNTFGFNLLREMTEDDPDSTIFISPLSVSYALGMTYNGAAGGTREAMADVLGVNGIPIDEFNRSYQALTQLLFAADPDITFGLANSIWCRAGFTPRQTFLDVNREYFDGLVRSLDFSLPTAADTINNWISEKTNGRINSVVSSPIERTVMLYLINAIYFNADWTTPFDSSETFQSYFTQADGSPTNCLMMRMQSTFGYAENELVKAVDLPYAGGNFLATVLIPKEGVSLNRVVDDLTLGRWAGLRSSIGSKWMSFAMPRLRLHYGDKLNNELTALGMGVAFLPDIANFDNILQNGGLYIGRVIHKTYLQVDERGTEAAGVTVVTVEVRAPGPADLTADHPYLFIIHEKESGAILFVGKIMTPTWDED